MEDTQHVRTNAIWENTFVPLFVLLKPFCKTYAKYVINFMNMQINKWIHFSLGVLQQYVWSNRCWHGFLRHPHRRTDNCCGACDEKKTTIVEDGPHRTWDLAVDVTEAPWSILCLPLMKESVFVSLNCDVSSIMWILIDCVSFAMCCGIKSK